MGRPPRIEFNGAMYHVMSRGVNRCPIFHDDLDRMDFLAVLREMVDCGWLIVHAYCLMGNHFHLLCETPLGRLGRCMQQLLGRYTRRFNPRCDRVGHLWQARYKAILVQEGEYFLHCSRYTHLNPVKARLVRLPEEYQWSSYRAYMEPDNFQTWISRGRTLGCFARVADYAAFILDGIPADMKDPITSASGGIAFGDEAFVEQVRLLVREPTRLDNVFGFNELRNPDRFSEGAVSDLVEQVCGDLSVCQKTRLLVYCLRKFTILNGREIAKLMGRTPSAVSQAWSSLQKKISKCPEFQERLTRIEDALLDES